VLQARRNLITADPPRLQDSVDYIQAQVRPAVEAMAGSLGMSLYANPELGVAVLESFWASSRALLRSEEAAAAMRDDAARRALGTVSVERYLVPVFELEAAPATGAGVRLARMDIKPSRLEDAVETYGDTAVPALAETEGFCSTLLLVDLSTGRSISETVWRSDKALAASRAAAAEVRVEAVTSAGWVIRGVEEYELVFSSARKQ
jgi:hypothetical protein